MNTTLDKRLDADIQRFRQEGVYKRLNFLDGPQAPGVAMDRAEHVAMGLAIGTPAGVFEDCVMVVDTTPLEPDEETVKVYAPNVGLIVDGPLELVEYDQLNLFGERDFE